MHNYYKCECGAARTTIQVGNATYFVASMQDLNTFTGGNIPEHSIHRMLVQKEKEYDGTPKPKGVTQSVYELISAGACQR